MFTVNIDLNSIDSVKNFVNIVTKFDCDFDLGSGRHVVDAKSIMGIFSLDLSRSVTLSVHAERGSELAETIKAQLTSFIVD